MTDATASATIRLHADGTSRRQFLRHLSVDPDKIRNDKRERLQDRLGSQCGRFGQAFDKTEVISHVTAEICREIASKGNLRLV